MRTMLLTLSLLSYKSSIRQLMSTHEKKNILAQVLSTGQKVVQHKPDFNEYDNHIHNWVITTVCLVDINYIYVKIYYMKYCKNNKVCCYA